MSKKVLAVIGLFLTCCIVFILKTLRDAGEFKKLRPHFAGIISRVEGVVGAEDITIARDKAIAYISSDDRYAAIKGRPAQGGIYGLRLDIAGAEPFLLKRIPEQEIHPHGISYYLSPSGEAFLFVVDHTGGRQAILIYQFQGDSILALKRIIHHPMLVSPNDITAVDEDKFYCTNDHGSAGKVSKMLEDYLQLQRSHVVYYDGKQLRVVAKGIGFSNGIQVSKDGKEVYVAATTEKRVHVYERGTDGGLTLKTSIDLHTGVDNIELDYSGNLWIGCHPKLLTFVRHAADTSRQAPSQVIRVVRHADGSFTSDEVFLNSGNALSGSSVAAVYKDILLIGPVLERHFLRCTLPAKFAEAY
ncbi:MAG: arylesterase [Chitinophagales bacterium]|nr:MAG: arylesterase [Chitinophagales bacterium]